MEFVFCGALICTRDGVDEFDGVEDDDFFCGLDVCFAGGVAEFNPLVAAFCEVEFSERYPTVFLAHVECDFVFGARSADDVWCFARHGVAAFCDARVDIGLDLVEAWACDVDGPFSDGFGGVCPSVGEVEVAGVAFGFFVPGFDGGPREAWVFVVDDGAGFRERRFAFDFCVGVFAWDGCGGLNAAAGRFDDIDIGTVEEFDDFNPVIAAFRG